MSCDRDGFVGRLTSHGMVAAATALCAALAASAGVILKTYVGPVNGQWNVAGNWSPIGVPDNGGGFTYDALIDNDARQNRQVNLAGAFSIQALGITAEDSLTIANGSSLGIGGRALSNDGTLLLGSTNAATSLRADADLVISGPGQITTTNSQSNRIHASSGALRITIDNDHTLAGSFQLGLNQTRLTNHGLIQANLPAGAVLDLTDGPHNFNAGAIRAANGATLSIIGSTIDNTGGLIEADAGSTVTLNNVTLRGGVISDADGSGNGSVRSTGTVVLEDLSIAGGLRCSNSSATRLRGAIDLDGIISLRALTAFTTLVIDTTPFTLSSTGTIVCTASATNQILASAWGNRLIIERGASIRGGFTLGDNDLALTNFGTIDLDADTFGSMDLTAQASNFNGGLIRASSTSQMFFEEAVLDNTGGVIEVADEAAFRIANSTISGGVLRNASGIGGTASLENYLNNLFENVTFEGEFRVLSGTTATARTSAIVDGQITLAGVNAATAFKSDSITFSLGGAGETVGTNSPFNELHCGAPPYTLTIEKNHTVRGAVVIGTGRIINHGSIHADSSIGMKIFATPSMGFDHHGLLRLSGGDVTIGDSLFTMRGIVQIEPGRTLTRVGDYTQLEGLTTVDGVLSPTAGLSVLGGQLEGTGVIAKWVDNISGIVAPGNPFGALSINGAFMQGPSGILEVELTGTALASGSDQLVVNGTAHLDGTLVLKLANGFHPAPGDHFEIVTSTGPLTGMFNEIDFGTIDCGSVTIEYGPNGVTIHFVVLTGIVGDINNDGLVNGADLALVLGNWGPCSESCCTGDLDGNGLVNGADLAIVLGNWSP